LEHFGIDINIEEIEIRNLHLAIFEDELVKIFERCFGDKRNAIHITISL
jgi:hypothetical protein